MPSLEVPAIDALMEHFVNAWNRGDIEDAMAIYADDASFLSHYGYIYGRENILAWYRSWFDPRKMGTLTLERLELRRSSTLATQVVRWTQRLPDKRQIRGHSLGTYKLRDQGVFLVQDVSL